MKAVWVLVAVSLILLMFGSLQAVGESYANYYYPSPWGPYIIFNSPTNNSYLKEAAGSTLTLDISVGTMTFAEAPGETYVLTYSLDGQPYKSLPTVYEGIIEDHGSMAHSVNTGRTSLPNMLEGNHTIIAHCVLEVDNTAFIGDLQIFFNIDNTPPKILIQTLDNKTYDTTDLPLNFTINEPFHNLSYSLDGNQSVQVDGNTTLTGLTSRSHSLTVYAEDRAGNIAGESLLDF